MPPPLRNRSSLIHTTNLIANTTTQLQIRDHVGNAALTVVQTIVSEAEFPTSQNTSATEPNTTEPSSGGLSGDTIAGIVLGFCFCAFVWLLVRFLWTCILDRVENKRRRKARAPKPGKRSEAQEGNEENTETYANRVSNPEEPMSSSQQLPTTDRPSIEASTTTAAQPLVTGSPEAPPSTAGDEDNNQYTINAPDVAPNMEDLLEWQRKLQDRRNRLLELERLDREEEELRGQIRHATVDGQDAVPIKGSGS